MNADADRRHAATRIALLAAILAIYLPDVGHGFVQDDFAWILHARGTLIEALNRAFTTSLGFFRPLVTLSFTADEWLFGLEPFGYGLTNLVFAIACALALERLARRLGLLPRYALLAAGVWVFNFHGINMGVLWLSGRSSLLSTLFGLLAAHALLERRRLLTIACVLLALMSKEDAVMLPVILTAWATLGGSKDPPKALRECWPLFVLLGVYAVLRYQSGAFTPVDAPVFYRFTTDPSQLLRNLAEYLVRSAGTGAAVLIVLALVTRTRPRLDRMDVTIVTRALLWWAGGFAITMWLPVRSSLYAVFPSVGIALIAATLATSMVSPQPSPRRRLLLVAGVLAPFLLLPIYWSRNVRWVSLADLTRATMAAAQAKVPALADQTIIELADDPSVRANFTNAFGGLTFEASQLFLERGIEVQIEPPPDPARPRDVIRLADVMYTR